LEYRSKISLLPSTSCIVKGISEQELNTLIPALLFIPIVENIFKHGSISLEQLPEVTLKKESGVLIFATKNNVDNLNKLNNEALKGFGLTSVKAAADLLFEFSELNIVRQDKKIIIELKFKPND
jgi:LytS/YehU family sensor histidine kinase